MKLIIVDGTALMDQAKYHHAQQEGTIYYSKKGLNKYMHLGRLIPAQVVETNSADRLLCACGKGAASENPDGEHFGRCRPCFESSLTARERRKRR